MVKVKEDLKGRVYGDITVLQQEEDYISPSGKRQSMWLCQCKCNNPLTSRFKARGSHLKRDAVTSCGHCGNGYHESELNLTDEHGTYGIGHCSNTGSPFYFDMQDFETIRWLTWHESIDQGGYHTLNAKQNGCKIKMAHLLGYKYYDHIDRNPLNNRRCNFRQATYAENARNRTIQKNNTSQIIGVHLDTTGSAWVARIQVDGERKYLGYFYNKEDAIRARLQAEVKYYGKFAPQQHLYKQYNITI